MPFLQLTVTISVLRLLLPDSEVTAKTTLVYNSSVHVVRAIHVCACISMNNQQTTSPLKIGLDVMQIHPLHRMCLDNTWPHQLRWSDREMGTAISCTE